VAELPKTLSEGECGGLSSAISDTCFILGSGLLPQRYNKTQQLKVEARHCNRLNKIFFSSDQYWVSS